MTRRRHLSTRPEWEDTIRSGRKDIDARLVADDIADVTVGAIIRYPGARVRFAHTVEECPFCGTRCDTHGGVITLLPREEPWAAASLR